MSKTTPHCVEHGLVVPGFPSIDAGAQEPETKKEVAEFCRLTYGIESPMFEKSIVTHLASQPLYAELVARTAHAPEVELHPSSSAIIAAPWRASSAG